MKLNNPRELHAIEVKAGILTCTVDIVATK